MIAIPSMTTYHNVVTGWAVIMSKYHAGCVAGLLGASLVISPVAAIAEPMAVQLRFEVSPKGDDAIWKLAGMTFEKQGECVYSTSLQPSTAWPQRMQLATGKAKAPIFNPGFAKPDGTYIPNSADDGFNTLFYTVDSNTVIAAKSVTCRGTILANGVDVTAEAPGRVTASTLDLIGKYGPPTVKVSIDTTKIAAATKPSTPTPVQVNQGKLMRHGTLGFQPTGKTHGDLESGLTFVPPNPSAGPADLYADMHVLSSGTAATKKIGNAYPLSGAHFAGGIQGSATPRGYAFCKNKDYSGVAPGVNYVNGLYYCFRTVEGHIAEIKPYEVPPTSSWGFAVEFWVWE